LKQKFLIFEIFPELINNISSFNIIEFIYLIFNYVHRANSLEAKGGYEMRLKT